MMTREERLAKSKERQTDTIGGGTKYHFSYRISKDIPQFKPKVGYNYIDIVQYIITNPNSLAVTQYGIPVGELDYFQYYAVHKNIGPDKHEYLCEKRTFNGQCPLCNIASEKESNGEETKDLYATQYVVYNVIERNDPTRTIKLWKAPYNWTEKELKKVVGAEQQAGEDIDYTDYEIGKSIKFMGEERTFNGHKFVEPKNFQFVERTTPITIEDCRKAYPIDSYFVHEDDQTLIDDYYGMPVTFRPYEKDNTQSVEATQNAKTIPTVQPASEVVKEVVPVKESVTKFVKRTRVRPTVEPACKLCSMGLKFGIDNDKYPEKCNNCDEDEWNKCAEEHDKLNK